MTDKILITSALPYVSATKHLGNLCGSLLPADVHARFRRQRGDDVLFLCGTDDHGTPVEIAAEAAGIEIARFVREQHDKHEALYAKYDLSFDHFGSTSSRRNHELTQEILLALHANGFLDERSEERLWSDVDGRFLPDRYVVGTCPHCGSTKARGDQCEACTKLLDPEQLIAPHSALSGDRDLKRRTTKHLYLRQDLLVDELEAWIDTREAEWSRIARSIARKWLKDGIEARCISRDLDWGVPIPLPGYEGKVAYVWFDAPIGYASIGLEWQDEDPAYRDFDAWWRGGEHVTSIQFVGKDSVPFHAITFPATLLGARSNLKTVDRLKAFNWLTFEGGKFSTSEGRGIFLDQALDILPSDAWRWWLTANAPENDDVDFTFDRLRSVHNSDLVGLLGNFVNRVLAFAWKRYEGTLPAGNAHDADLEGVVRARLAEIEAAHLSLEHRRAAAATRALWSDCNAWVVNNAPWQPGISNDDVLHRIRLALDLLRTAGTASAPILPASSRTISQAIGHRAKRGWPQGIEHDQGELRFHVPPPLFPKLEAAPRDEAP